MRKIWIAICTVLASCLMLVGCGGKSSQANDTLEAPTSLKMNTKGVLTWDEVEDATSYEVVIGTESNTVENTKQDLTEIVTSEGDYTVTVKAKNDTTTSEAASYSFKAKKLPTPSKPVIETDPYTHMVKFVWTGGENSRSYLQQINGGKWVSNAESNYAITSTGSYNISVKAKAYAANNVLYLDSDASEKSETYSYTQGPVLSLESINFVNWTSDVEFDSFNIWVNGQLAKENVVKDVDGLNLVLGSDPVLTKTGEYDVQIEALKNGESFWSNMLEEVGTSNINPNEIYSFDNRQAKFTTIKDGVSISDEQYHGESGYSLRYDATKSEQLNLITYAASGHVNDISFKTIKKVSYWVYIEPIEGFEGNFPASSLPGVKWEKVWTVVDKETGDETQTYKGCIFPATSDVPFGQWTKVEIDNVEMAYGNVIILSYPKTIAQNYVIYVDDISFEEVYETVSVDDAKYSVSYTAAPAFHGSWYAYNFTELEFGAENANKTLTVAMDVCGNADASLGNESVGFFNVSVPDKDPQEFQYLFLDAAKVSSLTTWNRIVLQLNTNAEGKCYLTGLGKGVDDNKVAPYSIFMKNVSVIDLSQVGGEEMPAGTEKTENANGYYQAFVGLTTNYAAGTKVTVEMDVYVTGTYNQYADISWIDTVWTTEGGELKASTTVVDAATMTANAGSWIHVTFDATVREFTALRLTGEYATVDVSSYGTAVYLVAHSFQSAESFNYKNVVITEKTMEGTAVPNGTEKTENANGYYQAFVGLPTTYEVGTAVTVEMDIYVTGMFDENSAITSVNMLWTTEGGEIKADKTIVDDATMTAKAGQWIHVTFGAMVRDYDVLRVNPAYSSIDVSAYGNAVFLAAVNFKSADSFNYKNVNITADSTAVPAGTEKVSGNTKQYQQAFVGLPVSAEVGTPVTVSMDIYITGDYDQYVNGIYWVDSVYTTAGGEVNASTNLISHEMMEANEGKWISITFEATVRNFAVLRLNDREYATMDTSAYGNAVYLAAHSFTSADSFIYKNVVITQNTAMPTGVSKSNGFYQSFVGLTTNLAEGTTVVVSMDILATGTVDTQYSVSCIKWVDTVYSNNAINGGGTIVSNAELQANAGTWIHVEFEATVRSFSLLRGDAEFSEIDVSAYGNAVYLCASQFKSAESFIYRNVVIAAK